MGSAESSALKNCGDLSLTLNEINEKLKIIEDLHLHSERSLNRDEITIVHGQKIKCLSTVIITVGPIVGLIGENFIRFLLEINQNAELTANIFIAPDNFNSEATYVFSTVSILIVSLNIHCTYILL